MGDITKNLVAQIQQAFAEKQALCIVGGNSKLWLGRTVSGERLDVSTHSGIVEYQPTELVIAARVGTPLVEIESALAERGQMLAFEPPHLGEHATLGGTIACGLSGPRRPFAGAARDFVLGAKLLNGRGELMQFGGQVMKNVAGYDVSRLMVGAQGTLGVLLEVSLKVLPRPACERSLRVPMGAKAAIETMTHLAGSALPLTAACHVPATAQEGGQLWLRLSGTEEAVVAAMANIQKILSAFSIREEQNETASQIFWQKLRERRLPFFDEADALWRLSVPPATPVFDEILVAEKLPGDCLLDWAGAQRWLKTDANTDVVQTAAQQMGGHATLFTSTGATFSPLNPVLKKIHAQLKSSFDPAGILNPGHLYEGL